MKIKILNSVINIISYELYKFIFLLVLVVIIVCLSFKFSSRKDHYENFDTKIPYRIIITGLAKNISQYMPNISKNINIISNMFTGPNTLIIYENDSTDNTVSLLNSFNFENGNKIIISEKNIKDKIDQGDLSKRTQRLAYGRNKILKEIETLKNIGITYDFIVNMDLDDVNQNINFNEIYNIFKKTESWDVLTANQKIYYDYWALRTNDRDINIFGSDTVDLPFSLEKYFQKTGDKYQEVLSAFGGLAIYKYNIIKDCYYDSDNGLDCEHVIFHKKIRNLNNGRIFIDRDLLNSGPHDNNVTPESQMKIYEMAISYLQSVNIELNKDMILMYFDFIK